MTRPVAIRTIVRHDRHDMDGAHPDQDLVAVEAPVSLLLQGPDGLVRDLGLLMRTPGHDEDLALGALVSEGVIRHSNDVRRVAVGDTAITVEVTASADVSAISARVTTATSACGLCGRLAMQHLDAWPHLARPADTPRISAAIIGTLSDRMRETQHAFAQTGGLHAAGLFTTDGTLVEVREDVGRHNAVDKIAGTLVRRDALPASDLVLAVSGRIAYEIVQKAAMCGLPLIVAVGAPTDLAVDAARATGITVVGFARDGRFNVYTHGSRITGDFPSRLG